MLKCIKKKFTTWKDKVEELQLPIDVKKYEIYVLISKHEIFVLEEKRGGSTETTIWYLLMDLLVHLEGDERQIL